MNYSKVGYILGNNYGGNQLEFRKSLVYFAFRNIKGRLHDICLCSGEKLI